MTAGVSASRWAISDGQAQRQHRGSDAGGRHGDETTFQSYDDKPTFFLTCRLQALETGSRQQREEGTAGKTRDRSIRAEGSSLVGLRTLHSKHSQHDKHNEHE